LPTNVTSSGVGLSASEIKCKWRSLQIKERKSVGRFINSSWRQSQIQGLSVPKIMMKDVQDDFKLLCCDSPPPDEPTPSFLTGDGSGSAPNKAYLEGRDRPDLHPSKRKTASEISKNATGFTTRTDPVKPSNDGCARFETANRCADHKKAPKHVGLALSHRAPSAPCATPRCETLRWSSKTWKCFKSAAKWFVKHREVHEPEGTNQAAQKAR
jgi:hypothetical protein